MHAYTAHTVDAGVIKYVVDGDGSADCMIEAVRLRLRKKISNLCAARPFTAARWRTGGSSARWSIRPRQLTSP
jgi:hypothetical protein